MDFSFQLSGAALTGNISPDAINSMGTLFGAAMGGIVMVGMLAFFAIAILMFVSRWKVFKKAGIPGRAILVPFYNFYCMFQLGGFSGRNVLWIFIPPVFAILMIINCFNIAKKFGKHWSFGFGILFLKCIFIPILAFDDSKYLNTKNTTTFTTKTITTPAKKIVVAPTVAVVEKKIATKTPSKKPAAKKTASKKITTTKPSKKTIKKPIAKKTTKPAPKKVIKKK